MMKTLQSALLKFALILITATFINAATAADAVKGEQIFKTNCTACHAIGSTLVGPDLTGVKSRWKDEKKLIAFVKNSQAVIASGDNYAVSLFNKFNKTIMPAQDLSDDQIADVIEYANGGSAGTSKPTEAPVNNESYSPIPKDNSFINWIVAGIVILVVIIFLLSTRLLKSVFGGGARNQEPDTEGAQSITSIKKLNAILMPVFFILFFGLIIYESFVHTKFIRPEAASETGQEIDFLFNLTLVITGIVFVLTHILLFWYSYRYRAKKGGKGYFYPHNNTIEFVWTSIPAVVLAGLVLYGFKTWQKATGNPDDNPVTIEAYAKQFDWTFRYPGPDGKLGKVDFRKIDMNGNPLGIDFSDPASHDDFLATELHLPVKRDIYIKLRSQDVTHAAYLPHFRAQMYANPGMDTRMRFKPLYTTEEFRKRINNDKFDYELACNQLCGSAHFNMRRVVIVEDDAAYNNWLKTDKKPAYEKYKAQQGQTAQSK